MCRAGAAARRRLDAAREAGFLQRALQPDRELGSPWQRLAFLGRRSLEQACSLRAFEAAGNFLEEELLEEMGRAASCRQNLATVARAIRLHELLEGEEQGAELDDRLCASALSALVGELQERGAEGGRAVEVAIQQLVF